MDFTPAYPAPDVKHVSIGGLNKNQIKAMQKKEKKQTERKGMLPTSLAPSKTDQHLKLTPQICMLLLHGFWAEQSSDFKRRPGQNCKSDTYTICPPGSSSGVNLNQVVLLGGKRDQLENLLFLTWYRVGSAAM